LLYEASCLPRRQGSPLAPGLSTPAGGLDDSGSWSSARGRNLRDRVGRFRLETALSLPTDSRRGPDARRRFLGFVVDPIRWIGMDILFDALQGLPVPGGNRLRGMDRESGHGGAQRFAPHPLPFHPGQHRALALSQWRAQSPDGSQSCGSARDAGATREYQRDSSSKRPAFLPVLFSKREEAILLIRKKIAPLTQCLTEGRSISADQHRLPRPPVSVRVKTEEVNAARDDLIHVRTAVPDDVVDPRLHIPVE